jgi:hypothetical protein
VALDTALCLSGDPGGFPWRSFGIIGGQRECPLGIIAMFLLHCSLMAARLMGANCPSIAYADDKACVQPAANLSVPRQAR